MNSPIRRGLVMGLLSTITGSAIAELPPIFITAGRIAEPVEDTLYSTSTVTAEEIERLQPRDVGEILERLPGIEIGRNGGPGQVTSAFIRGAASDQTLLLIDGVPVNSGSVGSPAFQHFMADQIDRVEVVRGPASTLYGSGAIGGVVQLLTPRVTKGTTARVATQGGSDDTMNLNGSFAHGAEHVSARFAVSRRETDGYPILPTVSSIDRGYDNDSFSGSLAFHLGDVAVDVGYFRSEGDVEYLDFFGDAVDQDTLNGLARVSFEVAPTDIWQSRLLLAYVRDKIEENQSDDFAKTERDYIDWQNTFVVSDEHTLVGGITANWTDTELLSFGSGYDERIRSIEYYLQHTMDLGKTRLQIGGRAIDNQQYGNNYTWNFAVGQQLTDQTRLHANAGTAFRAPSANDLYLPFTGNPDFDPEESISGEVGITHRVTPNDTLRLVAFRTEIDDLIEFNLFTFENTQIEKARIKGVEFGYSHRSSRWTWSLDYTYMDPKNRDFNQKLARRARNKVDASIGYDTSNWWTEAALRYQSERLNGRPSAFGSEVKLDSYTTVDLGAGYRFSPSVTVSGRVQNLFDEEYALAATGAGDLYLAQDRFFSVELRYDYDRQ